MKRSFLIGVVLAFIVCGFWLGVAAQDIVYGTPIAQSQRTKVNITSFTLRVSPNPRIEIDVADSVTSEAFHFSYPAQGVASLDTDAEVAALIATLNTTNFSGARSGFNTGPLRYRIADFLCRDFSAKLPSGSCSVQ